MLNMVNDCINFVSSGWYQYVDFLYVYANMLYACVCTCVWVSPVCICGEAWGQCRASFFLCCCPPYFLETKSLMVWPVSPWDRPRPTRCFELTGKRYWGPLLHGCWGSRLSSHVWGAGMRSLPRSPLPRLQYGVSTISRKRNKYFL